MMSTILVLVILCACNAAADDHNSSNTYDGEPEVNNNCYDGEDTFPEGLLGQISQFPWIGVLRIHTHDDKGYRVGATGVILIKEKYSLVNANDLSRISVSLLRRDGEVLFIPTKNKLWFCKVKEYLSHPEHQILTFNTIGILELEPKDEPFSFNHICWPSFNLSTENELYGIGYTDENQRMEKIFYKLQFVPKEVCREFYNRSNLLQDDMQEPERYHCAFAPNLHDTCSWENGMAVATNVSGVWMLVGLIVHGPGCSSPARFLDFSAYLPWIEVTTSNDDNEEKPNRRRLPFINSTTIA